MNRTNPADAALFTAAMEALIVLRNIAKVTAIITKDDAEPIVISKLDRALQDAEKDMETNSAIAEDNPLA